jgi:hypothetical protein
MSMVMALALGREGMVGGSSVGREIGVVSRGSMDVDCGLITCVTCGAMEVNCG